MKKYILLPILLFCVVAYGASRIGNSGIVADGTTISNISSSGSLTLDPGTAGVIFTDLTATTVPYLGSSKEVLSSAVTPTELGYVGGVTSAIQTQIDAVVEATLVFVSKTTTYLATTSEHVILVDSGSGAFTVTLPTAASSTGHKFYFKKISSDFNNVLINSDGGSEGVDSDTKVNLDTRNESYTLASDGTKWHILTHRIDGQRFTFTPSWTNLTIGNGSSSGAFWREGNFMVGYAKVIFGSSTTMDAGVTTFTIPESLTYNTSWQPSDRQYIIGWTMHYDTDGGPVYYHGFTAATSTEVIILHEASNTSYGYQFIPVPTAPMTWATGDIVVSNFRIPITEWDDE